MEIEDHFSAQVARCDYYESGSDFGGGAFGKLLEKLDAALDFTLKPSEKILNSYADLFLINDHKSKPKQIVIAIHLFVCSILFATTIIVSSCFKRALSLRKKDFVWIGPKDSPQAGVSIDKISVGTFNMALLPEFISRRNRLRCVKERAEEMALSLSESLNNQGLKLPDIFWGQEVFEQGDKLAEDFKKLGYSTIIRNIGESTSYLNSGLFLASRYPVENPVFYPHPLKMGVESNANKGLFIATALVGDKKIVIASTHLNGGCPLGGFIPRAVQVQAILAHIDRYVKNHATKEPVGGVIFSGDFNIGPIDYCDKHDDYYFEKESYWHQMITSTEYDESLYPQPFCPQKRKEAIEALKQLKQAIPTNDLENPRAWEKYTRLLKIIENGQMFPKIDDLTLYLKNMFEKNAYSPLPRKYYDAHIYTLEEGLNGTILDTLHVINREFAKEPKKLDYHLVRTDHGLTGVKVPEHLMTKVIDIKHQPSDHCFVYSEFSLKQNV